MAYKELDVFLARNQTTLGTALTDIANTDFRAVANQFSLDVRQEFSPINLASGGFGQQAQVKGAASVDVKISLPVVPTGSVTAPHVADFLKASGMSETVSTNLYTYAPSSAHTTDWKDQTAWSYTGDKTSGDCLLTKAHSVMYDWELEGEVGKPLMLNLTGKGCLASAPAAASFVSGTLTMPSGTVPAVVKATTMTIGGLTGLKIVKFKFSIGNSLQLIKDPSQDYGYSRCDIAGRESKFQITAIQENLNPNNPYTIMDTPTLATTTFTFGVAGSRISIGSAASKSQIIDIKNADDNGIKIFDISGIFVDNDFTFAINVA
jgi:hypothetical protein